MTAALQELQKMKMKRWHWSNINWESMIDTQQLLNDHDIVSIIGRHVHLEKKGSEFVGICPFHEDDKASLTVNPRKQIFKCFACGGPGGSGGDAIHFVMGLGMDFKQACDHIANGDDKYITTAEIRPSKAKIEPEWKQLPPNEWPTLPKKLKHPSLGVPSGVWTYKNESSEPVGYVCRFDFADGSKQVLPLIYASNGNETKWKWLGMDKPRPLYNLDLIASNPGATIMFVEGEKTADAAQNELNPQKTVVTTWVGGANGLVSSDFTTVHGRKVILWPDHDTEQRYGENHEFAGQIKPWNEQPGNQAMMEVATLLKPHCNILRWVNVPPSFPHKWDAADKQWEPDELRQFVKKNMADVPVVDGSIQELVERSEASTIDLPPITHVLNEMPPMPPQPMVDDFGQNEHFKLLGYDKDENGRLVYYFFSFDAKTTIKLTPPSMSKANLMMIAPINWWENQFPGAKTKFDLDSAQQFMMARSHKIGMFKEKFIRGRGAWIDDERFVIHTGDELIVNEKPTHLRGIESKYVYEIGEKMGLGCSVKLPNAHASQLIEKMKWLKWEREINAYLIAGWCVIAPFCGVLRWRPHIWVTGPAGSGKSWTMDNVVKRLLGEAAIVVQGKTTEAGVRGLLQNDARAVLFDESDVDSNNDKERIQSILALARSSSYHDGGVIGKGTQTGSSKTYTMRSCFAFSSIGVQLNQQSDRSRFTMLGLMSFEKHRTKEDFVNFEHDWNKLTSGDFVQQLQARTIHLLPIILKNASTFSDAASAVIGQRRIGEQVGGMLAGAYSLTSGKEISYDDAVEWVSSKNWDEEIGLELTKDEYQLFTKLMGHPLRIEAQNGIIERTIGETILIANRDINEFGLSAESATNRLRRIGIIVHDKQIFVSNTADGIKNIIRNTPWANNHNKILERLPNATRVEPRVYYPGCKSRGVALPLSMLTEDAETFNLTPTYSYLNDDKNDKDDLPF